MNFHIAILLLHIANMRVLSVAVPQGGLREHVPLPISHQDWFSNSPKLDEKILGGIMELWLNFLMGVATRLRISLRAWYSTPSPAWDGGHHSW